MSGGYPGTELLERVGFLLSEPRFDRYLKSADGDVHAAITLYQWNIEVSAAFYVPLHWLEISLRNSLDQRLRRWFGRDDWWHCAPLTDNGRRKVSRAEGNLVRSKGRGFSPDDVVAELTFGFWVSLLSRVHDRSFWVPVLHNAFPHYRGARNLLHGDFVRMLDFRNRVMHHEPIFYLDLEAYRQRSHRLLGYLSREVAEHVRSIDNVPSVLTRRREL